MNSLGELLTRHTAAPAIVVGAIAHAEIAVVAPFGEASGLIARAAEHLVLISAGVDPYGVIVVEAGHAESGSTYSAGLDARGRHRRRVGIGCCAAQQPWRAALSFRRQVAVEHHDAGRGRCCYGTMVGAAKDGTTRRPPRRAPCLTRHPQVTMRAFSTCWSRTSLERNFPSGMGDRRVGAYLTC